MCYHGTEQWEDAVERLVEEEPEEDEQDRKEPMDEDEKRGKNPAPADD